MARALGQWSGGHWLLVAVLGLTGAAAYGIAPDSTLEPVAVETILRPGSNTNPNPRADIQRPSMAQDIQKGRRTEIEFMNGFIGAKGRQVGTPAPTHEALTEIVKQVERGTLAPKPENLFHLLSNR